MPAPSSRMPYREYRAWEEFEVTGSPSLQESYSSAKVVKHKIPNGRPYMSSSRILETVLFTKGLNPM